MRLPLGAKHYMPVCGGRCVKLQRREPAVGTAGHYARGGNGFCIFCIGRNVGLRKSTATKESSGGAVGPAAADVTARNCCRSYIGTWRPCCPAKSGPIHGRPRRIGPNPAGRRRGRPGHARRRGRRLCLCRSDPTRPQKGWLRPGRRRGRRSWSGRRRSARRCGPPSAV